MDGQLLWIKLNHKVLAEIVIGTVTMTVVVIVTVAVTMVGDEVQMVESALNVASLAILLGSAQAVMGQEGGIDMVGGMTSMVEGVAAAAVVMALTVMGTDMVGAAVMVVAGVVQEVIATTVIDLVHMNVQVEEATVDMVSACQGAGACIG